MSDETCLECMKQGFEIRLRKRRNHEWQFVCPRCGRKWILDYHTHTWAGGQTTGESNWRQVEEWPADLLMQVKT